MAWNTPYKERRTEECVYFVTGEGSQWFPSLFAQALKPGGPEYVFCSREQYMMACKAAAFEDDAALEAVLRAVPPDRKAEEWARLPVERIQETVPATMARVFTRLSYEPVQTLAIFNKYPQAQKKAGRGVASYDDATWASMREECVYSGSVAAAAQEPLFRRWLLSTEGLEIVEGSAKDRIWGVGIAWDDDRILDRANWNGLNLLGKANTRARDWCVRNAGFLEPAELSLEG